MRKRSSYRPRAVTNPLMRLTPAERWKREHLLVQFDSALFAITNGKHPGMDDWQALTDAINTVEVLAMHTKALPELQVMPIVQSAIEAMVRAADRFKAGHGMRMDGPAVQVLRDVIDIYAQAMELLPEAVVREAQAETARRMRALLAGKTPAHGHVIVEAA